MLKYASVCSGIEAATVAWKHMNWQAVWLSEIETFPCDVLKHHYPDTPNLGDMTKVKGNDIYEQSTFDVFVGGTPCQSFSIAGLRGGMADDRGNLALEYCRILIDKSPRWFVWENVPGVFSSFSYAPGSEDNDSDRGSNTGGGTLRHSDEGDVFGGDEDFADCTETSDFATLLTAFRECGYSCAWRVFDSRHFGVPQRRRRVFVVGYIGKDWRPPIAVLFERESLSRDFTPSRKKGKATTTSTVAGTQGGDRQWPADTASTLNTKFGDKMGLDNQHINEGAPLFVPVSTYGSDLSQKAEAIQLVEETSVTLTAGKHLGHGAHVLQPAYGIQANIVNRTEKSGGNGLGVKEEEEAPTLTKNDQHCVMQPIVIDRAAFNQGVNAKYDAQTEHTETAPCLIKSGSHAVMTQPIILDDQGGNVMTVYDQGHVGTLRAQTHGHEPIVFGFDSLSSNSMKSSNPHSGCHIDDVVKTLDTSVPCPSKNQGGNAVLQSSMVRRLTPLECCRLQGFPDDYMDGVPNASDSKWYAAFGNTMTIQVVKWIGERIDKVDKLITKLNSK